MKKLAVIGASYLQEPLIQKAKSMGIETHVFAWAADDVGEKSADYFYPVSIIEKEEILRICREIKIDGICSIASDLAVVTVNFVADQMGLVGNSMESTRLSTNKFWMRRAFEENGDPSPVSILVTDVTELGGASLRYPVIVKPTDRSGSRGITELKSADGLAEAVEFAKEQGFDRRVLVEEFVSGQEYSVECISWRGKHHLLAVTEKYTTGAPHFIERGHLEPARVSDEMFEKIKDVVFHALDSLKIADGASHTEVKITEDGSVVLIETGARMGGDYIGSALVEITTGIDYVRAVIQIALGEEPDLAPKHGPAAAAVRFVFSKEDIEVLEQIRAEHPDYIVSEETEDIPDREVMDSSGRFGVYLLKAASADELELYMPAITEEEDCQKKN